MKNHLTTQHLDELLARPAFVREPKRFSKYINIGGCPYCRKALLSGHPISIYAATETKLSITRHSYKDNQEWIELDNDQLELFEKGQDVPNWNYPKLTH